MTPKVSPIGYCDYSGGNANFVLGCTPISEGCVHCYARRQYERWGKTFSQVTLYPEKVEALKTQDFGQYSPKRGQPYRPIVFVCDMGDLFHEAVPFEFIWAAVDVMIDRSDVIWLVLTKRAERMGAFFRAYRNLLPYLPDNIWLGVTVENMAAELRRIPHLIDTPAAVRWLSVEPMLGPLHLLPWFTCPSCGGLGLSHCASCHGSGWASPIDWVACGAESGPQRRDFSVSWAESLAFQCHMAGVAFYGKQDSGLRPGTPLMIHGREIKEWPDEC